MKNNLIYVYIPLFLASAANLSNFIRSLFFVLYEWVFFLLVSPRPDLRFAIDPIIHYCVCYNEGKFVLKTTSGKISANKT